MAYVIPRPGEAPSEEELIAHCKGRIASYKVPRHVRVVADVPRTPGPHGDKAQKSKLRELFLAERGGVAGPEDAEAARAAAIEPPPPPGRA